MTGQLAARAEADTAAAGWQALRAAAVDRYRADRSDRFGWRFARGKLGADPLFRHLLAEGLIPPGAQVLDLGCGQGLVASLVAAAGDAVRAGRWPPGWAEAPLGSRVTGVEIMPRDAARAAAGGAEVVCGDLRRTPFPRSDVVLLLDVLHYLAPAEQDEVLARVRAALPLQGGLLMRVGDASGGFAFRRSQWVDGLVALFRRRRSVALHGRAPAAWTERLQSLGFAVEARPMSQGTPFANVLLVARVTAELLP